MLVVHIASRADWEAAADRGRYTHPSLDDDGYIHCSRPEQVESVVNAGDPPSDLDLVGVLIETDRVEADVKWESGRTETGPDDPEAFPHVYGPIDTSAVVDVVPFETEDGRYYLPDRRHDITNDD